MVFVVAIAVSFFFLSQAISPVTGSSCTLKPGEEALEVNGCDWLSFLESLEEQLEDNERCGDRTLSEELEYLDEEFQESVGKTTKEAVDTYCADAWSTFDTSSFSEIDGEFTDDFMKKYTMGLTHLNSNTGNFQGNDVSERDGVIGENIDDFRNNEAEEKLMQSFGDFDTSTCEGQAIMCCFGRDRQFGDDNGNCANDDCEDADPADNSNLCYTESQSYPDDDPPENDIHCHGVAWGEDPNDFTGKLAFNNFFYVSLYDHMYSRGYVERTIRREYDAAEFRMCDCVEKMPVVTRSDCTEVQINSFGFERNAENDLLIEPPESLDIQFNSCEGVGRDNDLSAYIRRLVNEGRFGEELQEYTLKYERKWPHCDNVRCYFGTRTRDFMQEKCDEEELCDGFSFTTNSDTGWGCLKKCGFDDSDKGYGSGTHDYWVKQVPQAYETLVGYRNPNDNDNEEACEAVSPPPTAAPVAPPSNAPVLPPTGAPVLPPTGAPVLPPTGAPVLPPTGAPVLPPNDAPVLPPTDAPIVTPTAPVEITTSPSSVPTSTPSESSSSPPVENIKWEDIFVETFDGVPNKFKLKEKRITSSVFYEGNSTVMKNSQKMKSNKIKKMKNYSMLEVEFWYYGESLGIGNGLIMEAKFDKEPYTHVKGWKMGEDFSENGDWQHAVATIEVPASGKKLRLQLSVQLGKNQKIFVDELTVRGATSSKRGFKS